MKLFEFACDNNTRLKPGIHEKIIALTHLVVAAGEEPIQGLV